MTGSGVDVAEAFNNALLSDSTSALQKLARGLWARVREHGVVDSQDARQAVSMKVSSRLARALHAPDDALHMARIAAFLGQLAATAAVGSEGAAAAADDVALQVLGDALWDVAESCASGIECVRLRACQFIHAILQRLPRAVSPEVAASLHEALVQRMDDKSAKVRRMAVHATSCLMGMLQETEAASVREALRDVLQCERTKGVRVAVISAVPLTDDTLDFVLERTQDKEHEVRASVYKRLQQVSASVLSIHWRVLLVKRGLRDGVEEDVQAEAQKLVCHWLAHDCQDNPEQLLLLLEAELHAEAAELALEAMLSTSSSSIPCTAMLQNQGQDSVRLRCVAPAEPSGDQWITAEKALYWRFLCLRVHKEAAARSGEAAATTGNAASALAAQALDSFLPDTAAAMCSLILTHVQEDTGHWFAALQLMDIAGTCMDWTDQPSRQAAIDVVQALLLLDPRSLHSSETGANLAALGGDDSWEASVCKFLRAVCGTDLEVLAELMRLLQLAAAQWGLTDSAGSVPASLLLQYLAYAAQALAIAAVVPQCSQAELEVVLDTLVVPAVTHPHVTVKLYGMRCMSLAGLVHCLRPRLPRIVSLLCVGLQERELRVQQEAVQGLCNLLVVHGERAVDEARCSLAAQLDRASEVEHVSEVLQDMRLEEQMAARAAGDNGSCEEGAANRMNGSLRQEGQKQQGGGRGSGGEGGAGRLPLRPVVLLLVDKCRKLMVDVTEQGNSELDEDEVSLALCVTEGLARIMAHQEWQLRMTLRTGRSMHVEDRTAQAVLAQLLALNVHPATEALPAVRQTLEAFFKDFAGRCRMNKNRLCDCVVAAVRAALQPGHGKSFAVPLIKYTVRLLAVPDAADQEVPPDFPDRPFHTLALSILLLLSEPHALGTGAKKTDVLRELGKLLLALAPLLSEQNMIRAILVRLEACEATVTDTATLASLHKVRQRVEQLEDPTAPRLADDEVALIFQGVREEFDLAPAPAAPKDTDQAADQKRTTRSRAAKA